MPLTDVVLRKIKPGPKTIRIADEKGLYLIRREGEAPRPWRLPRSGPEGSPRQPGWGAGSAP
jgi:hypothetical protein